MKYFSVYLFRFIPSMFHVREVNLKLEDAGMVVVTGIIGDVEDCREVRGEASTILVDLSGQGSLN